MKADTILIIFSRTLAGTAVDEIKPIKMYFISLIFFIIAIFGLYISTMAYRSYFLMGNVVTFSFPYASFILGWPLLIIFSFTTFMCGYQKKTQRINRKLSNLFSVFAILGIVFSFVFSFYVEYDLTSRGYVKCYKKSLLAPTEYVISKDMCE